MDSAEQTKKKQKIILYGGIGAFIVILMLGMYLGDPNRGKPTPMEVAQRKSEEVKKDFTVSTSDAVSAEETWISLSEKQFRDLEAKDKEYLDKINQLENALRDIKEKGVSGGVSPANPEFSTPIPTGDVQLPPPPIAIGTPSYGGNQNVGSQQLPPPPAPMYPNSQTVNQPGQGPAVSTIQVVKLSSATDGTGQANPKKQRNVNNYLQAGMFATVTMLSGLDAPTGGQAKSNPVPVLIRIMDPGTLPNHFRSGVKDCHVVGSGYGDIASERVHIRTETISCTLVNGDIIEESLKGYIAGEDGKAGFRGRLVSKQGSLIAKTLLAGALGGAANFVNQSYQQTSQSALGSVTTIDPNKIGQAGAAGGASNAMEKLADFYMARANEIYPIIEVDANRIGELILTGGTETDKNLIGNTREHK